uniref:Uncharacterized protein n=1 Tax=Manihot esculenta TaxID=3983 RepID=A0A2C9W2N1_MANES
MMKIQKCKSKTLTYLPSMSFKKLPSISNCAPFC